MKSGTVPTTEIKAVVEAGIAKLTADAVDHRQHGRLGEAEGLERFCEYAAEYLRLLENTINANAETIRVLEETIKDLR